VLGIHDRAVLVAVAAGAEILDDHEPDDGLVLLGSGALGADFGLALRVVWLGETGDLAEQLAALLVDLHVGDDLAGLLVDRLPLADDRIERHRGRGAQQRQERHGRNDRRHPAPPLWLRIYFGGGSATTVRSVARYFWAARWTSAAVTARTWAWSRSRNAAQNTAVSL